MGYQYMTAAGHQSQPQAIRSGNQFATRHRPFRSPQKQSELNQVHPFDTASYVAAIFGLTFVGLLASVLPAQRAVRLDPMQALRNE
jgi:ABC-type lipoprotein release transport system permease subunit